MIRPESRTPYSKEEEPGTDDAWLFFFIQRVISTVRTSPAERDLCDVSAVGLPAGEGADLCGVIGVFES